MPLPRPAQYALFLLVGLRAGGCDVDSAEPDEIDPGGQVCAEPTPARPVAGLVPRLRVYQKVGEGVRALRDGALVRAGELVQITYMAAGNRQGVVLSVDGRGEVTLHHPASAEGSTSMVTSGEQPLGHAFELDDTPGFERFLLVTSGDRPTDVSTVVSAAQQLGSGAASQPLALPEDLRQTSLTLRKTP